MIYRLKEARVMNGKSIRDAAKELNMSHEGLRKYEKGLIKMDSERLIKFANFYKVPIDYLIPKERPKIEIGEIHICKIPKWA